MAKVFKRKYKTKVTWYADFTINGKRYRPKLDAQNKAQAQMMATEIEYECLQNNFKLLHRIKTITLNELADRYIEYIKHKKSDWKRDTYSLKNILPMVIDDKKLCDYNIDSIKVDHIHKYQILRKQETDMRLDNKNVPQKGRSYTTVNRELQCLRHMFNLAIEWELLSKNPVASKSIKFFKEKARNRTLDDAEFKSLLISSNEKMYPIVVLALNTGMRKGEIFNLTWENVILDEAKIIVRYTKNGEDREMPINEFLLKILVELPHSNEYVFTNLYGDQRKSIKTLWENTLKRANISDFHFHDLRHTVATRLAKAKFSESVIAMILGHKRSSITSRYINPHWDEMVEAVDVLGKLCHEFVTRSKNDHTNN